MKFFLSFVAVLAVSFFLTRFIPDAAVETPAAMGVSTVGGETAAACPADEAEEHAGHHPASTDAAAATPGKVYGAPITAEGALPVAQLSQVLGQQDSAQVKLMGPASGVCQAKGCWLTMQLADGKEMRVRFKDYGFFVPKDLTGKTIVVNGWAHREQVPVDYLRHYAKDAGKSEKEIAAITQPEQQVNFEADGVLVLN